MAVSRCDLHVHSIHSTDSGSYALRQARLGESYTAPERVYRTCRSRGMSFVTISDHNTVEGALRIAHEPGTFLSVEVTTQFPEDEVPLHVLVWGLSEEDHRDLQPCRPSVYELVAFLRERGLVHALAHPLYRMGAPLTVSHVERMMLLFSVWEGRNGARPKESNELACRLAASVDGSHLATLAERHGIEPAHGGRIALTGGSDDHGALDIATTWTDAPGETVDEFLASVAQGEAGPVGEHGSTLKLAHALAALFVNSYRRGGGELPDTIRAQLEALFDSDATAVESRHREIAELSTRLVRLLGARARSGGLTFASLPGTGGRLGSLAFAAGIQLPYLATAHHHAGSRDGLAAIEHGFFARGTRRSEPRALLFTDTFEEVNGVAGTMRRVAAAAAEGSYAGAVVVAAAEPPAAGTVALPPDWSLPLPSYEAIDLRFPLPMDALERIDAERPDIVHVATPGPVGLCGLLVARLLGIPVVGSYHTELGPYALHLTRDALVAQAIDVYVDWFYRQCATVLAPTGGVAAALTERGYPAVGVWGRGVDSQLFGPEHRNEELRRELLGDGELLLLSVGRLSQEKRIGVLLDAYALMTRERRDVRLVIAGDGPARRELELTTPAGTRFVGELRGAALAELYASCDVFCFPSTTDTFGQVILEAGASGLPVVAAEAGGARELVTPETTGLLVAPEEAHPLADALLRLAADPDLRARLGRGGHEAALARTWSAAIGELSTVYRRLLGLDVAETRAAA
jgi:glycosyltransferase involved in cell wall biosynthesis/predicted metal-dependent phosphoesterase TrpH